MSFLSVISYLLYYLFLHVKLGADAENFKLYGEDFFSLPAISLTDSKEKKDCEDLQLIRVSDDQDEIKLQVASEMRKSQTADLKVMIDGEVMDQVQLSDQQLQSAVIFYPALPYCDFYFEISSEESFMECNWENNRLHIKTQL